MTNAQTYMDLFDKSAKAKAWLEIAIPTAITHAKQNGTVTADDIRAKVPIPEGLDPRVVGAVFRKDTFINVGFVRSKRKECHYRPISKFRLRPVLREG